MDKTMCEDCLLLSCDGCRYYQAPASEFALPVTDDDAPDVLGTGDDREAKDEGKAVKGKGVVFMAEMGFNKQGFRIDWL